MEEVKDVCKYCNIDGDLGEDHSYMFNDDLDFGIVGKLCLAIYISGINRERKPGIVFQRDTLDTKGYGVDLGYKEIPIKYCPFCGRDLTCTIKEPK